jgi:hypothetical protein
MDHLFDEFSKSLTQSVPRRESLRRLGAVFAGAVLSPLGLESAWAAKADPCAKFCQCRNSKQQSQCLAACKVCSGNTGRLAGTCGNYTCCSIASCKGVCSNLKSDPNCGACGNNCRTYGQTCCGSYCADLKNDVGNCGRCGTVCPPPHDYQNVACVAGQCVYDCIDGSDLCDGTCTFLDSDPSNCGACGHVCPNSAPICSQAMCSPCYPGQELCGNACLDVRFDELNCGTCGNVCGGSTPYCSWGVCTDCVGAGGAICGDFCVDVMNDPYNCGACSSQCAPSEYCAGGFCFGVTPPSPY